MNLRSGRFISLATLVALAANTAPAHAQDAAQRIRYGVETGLTVSNFRYDHVYLEADARSRLAFSLGGAMTIPLQEFLDIRTGVRFARYGSRFDYNDGSIMGQIDIDQNYIAIPVIVRGRDSMTGQTFFGVGGEIGYLASANAKIREDYTTGPPSEEDFSIREDLQPFSFGLVFSAGAEFPVEDALWFIDFRYGLGLTDTAKDDPLGVQWKMRAIEVLVGGLW